ncbi:phospholipase/lecithinase/hemolysin [Pelomonas aquatica]|uniref:Phospholipase/lecithinase/hemolysin n=1 Tax=Pelomonas aquatica TaxID=431058 RepID=A0ABU1ZCM6_9BURK|nr:esterase [Pelomonas aquatica]MDR7298367.1 phospholipase/lecithinase/hemolysin [Pelomonas aquatica]
MQRVVSQKFKRGLALATMAAAALIAGCGGGGTAQIEPFAPTRVIAFGDESGTILQSGKKYTINGLTADTLLVDCTLSPVWSQLLAAGFAFVYPQCNKDFVALPQGIMYATLGDKVANVRDRIDQHLSNDRFGPKDLVAINVGVNDVLELYRQFPAQNKDSLINEAKARGKLLAEQANRIANANGRVVIATIFDVGLTPFGQKEKLQQTDIDRAAFLDELSAAFNISMRLNLLNDGRLIGLVLVDETIQQIARFPGAFGYSNVTQAACRSDVAPQDCTTSTLVTDANPTQWLWAGDTLLGPNAQQRIGTMFLTRAKNNPF